MVDLLVYILTYVIGFIVLATFYRALFLLVMKQHKRLEEKKVNQQGIKLREAKTRYKTCSEALKAILPILEEPAKYPFSQRKQSLLSYKQYYPDTPGLINDLHRHGLAIEASSLKHHARLAAEGMEKLLAFEKKLMDSIPKDNPLSLAHLARPRLQYNATYGMHVALLPNGDNRGSFISVRTIVGYIGPWPDARPAHAAYGEHLDDPQRSTYYLPLFDPRTNSLTPHIAQAEVLELRPPLDDDHTAGSLRPPKDPDDKNAGAPFPYDWALTALYEALHNIQQTDAPRLPVRRHAGVPLSPNSERILEALQA